MATQQPSVSTARPQPSLGATSQQAGVAAAAGQQQTSAQQRVASQAGQGTSQSAPSHIFTGPAASHSAPGVTQAPAAAQGLAAVQAGPSGAQAVQPSASTSRQPQPGGPQVQAGVQLPQQDVLALRREMQEMRESLGRMRRGRTADDLQDEVVQYAKRPWAAFDPQRAVGLLQTLVSQARREDHQKAREFNIIVDQITPLSGESYFKDLIINQLGSPLEKQLVKDIAACAKQHGAAKLQQNTSESGRRYAARTQNVEQRTTPYTAYKPGTGRSTRKAKSTDVCYNCWKPGHWSRDCFKPKKYQ
ncbi:uncharacterized protein [Branchiostoma lanceolatum]|uniref:uncharacterized protein n=1 Tax=Branchiostoma lanceolatum TaxID=7740 RepID=UPI003456E0CB